METAKYRKAKEFKIPHRSPSALYKVLARLGYVWNDYSKDWYKYIPKTEEIPTVGLPEL